MKKRPTNSRRFSSSLSLGKLEDRVAPAGLVAVSVSAAGALNLGTVAGLDGDEVVTVTRQVSGDYLLTPGAGVNLRIGGMDFATAQPISGVKAGLVAKLGTGNDQISFVNGSFTKSVSVDLGDGNNTFTMQDSAIGGNLQIIAKGGNDTINFGTGAVTNVGVAGSFKATLGDGTNIVQTNANRVSFGSVRVDGGVGSDSFLVSLNNLDFTTLVGGLTFNGGAGTNTVTLGDGTATIALAGPANISSPGPATINIGGARFDASSLSFKMGADTNVLASDALDVHVAGNLLWTSGSGNDTVNFLNTTLRVGGSLSILTADGTTSINVDPDGLLSIGKNLTVTSGNTTVASAQLVNSAGDVVIGGKVSLKAGTGNTNITLSASKKLTVAGAIQVAVGAGAGNTFVGGGGTLHVPGNISIKRANGQGQNVVQAATGGESTIGGSVLMTGGGQQRITMAGVIKGGVTFTGAIGAAAQMVLQSNGARPLQISGAIKLSSTSLATQASVIQLQGLIVEGGLTVNTGAGNENLAMDNNAFLNKFTATLGAGADIFTLEQQGVGGGSLFVGPVLFAGGDGIDTFTLGGNSAGTQAVEFKNSVKADGGNDLDVITLGTQLTFDPAHALVEANIP